MAKFCIYCGKKLEENEVCDCQKITPVSQEKKLMTDLLDVFKGMFVKPMDTLKKYTNSSSFGLGLILIGIFAVITSLFALSVVKNAYLLIMRSIGISSYSTLNYGLGSVDVPYLKIFFTTFVVIIILTFIYTGLLYLVNTIIFKGDKDYKKTFSMCAINTAISSVALFASTIFMFVHTTIALFILFVGLLLNIVYQVKSLNLLGIKDENKHGYIYTLTLVLNYLVLFILLRIFL